MSLKQSFTDAVKATAKAATAILPAKKTPAPETPPEKKPGPDPVPPEILLAWRTPGINPQLLVAYKEGTDPTNPNNLLSVNVRNNRLFMPGMKVRVRHVQGTIYDLVGPLPRWRGRM